MVEKEKRKRKGKEKEKKKKEREGIKKRIRLRRLMMYPQAIREISHLFYFHQR